MGMQGYQQGQDRVMTQNKDTLSSMKAMAELEKLQAQVPLYQAQSKLYNSLALDPQSLAQQYDEEQYEEGQEYEDDTTGERFVYQNGQLVQV